MVQDKTWEDGGLDVNIKESQRKLKQWLINRGHKWDEVDKCN